MKPRVRDDLTVIELDGEAIVYDEENRRLHHLNPSATVVFKLCDGQATVRELSEDIATAFGIDSSEVERQVRTLLRGFRKQGFLDGTPSSAGRLATPRGR